MEESDPAERNANQLAKPRTQSRNHGGSNGLEGVRGAARKDSKLKFTALLHHVDEDLLIRSFFGLKKTAAVGVDGVTWFEYERVERRAHAPLVEAPEVAHGVWVVVTPIT
jgi:RNA-directed DNA polymerase